VELTEKRCPLREAVRLSLERQRYERAGPLFIQKDL